MDWLNRKEVRTFLGLPYPMDEEMLEELIVDHDLDVELDDEGKIEFVGGDPVKLREMLFSKHESEVGYRPDDLTAAANAVHAQALEEDQTWERRAMMKRKLHRRVATRRKK